MKNLKFELLKSQVQSLTERENLPFSLLPLGLPKGAITCISGSGKTSFITEFLREHTSLKVAWMESNFSIYPYALLQKNISLNRVLFIESVKQTAWVALQVLKAQIFPVLILYEENIKLSDLRRLQLASEKAGAVTVWLTSNSQKLWPISLELEIKKEANGFKTQILRMR